MPCVSPPELEDIQLLIYLDGEAEPEVTAHLQACSHCRLRAEKLASLQQGLTRRLYRATCPTSLELGEYHLGLLSPSRTRAIIDHLAMCPLCAEELAKLGTFLSQPDPRREPSLVQKATGQVKVTIARLLSGPAWSGALGGQGLAPALAGIRGDEERPLIFEAGDIQIVLEVQSDVMEPESRSMLGLITGLEPAHNVAAHLWQDNQYLSTAAVDDLGSFLFEGITPGSYDLILTAPESEIHLQNMPIGQN